VTKLGSLLVAAALVVACAPDAKESAADGLKNLAEIRSGEISLDVSIAPQGEEEATGFALEGVFSLPEESGELPEADLSYTQRANGEEVEGRFVSDGESVFVEVDGERTELPPDQVEGFRVAGTESGDSVFQGLDATTWFEDPGTEESGDEVTLSGELDVVVALNDIFEVARSFGGTMEPIEGDEADIVRDSVRSASADITTGADGLLHHASVTIDFGVADPELSEALGSFAGATFSLELSLTNVNETVEVK
jgi:hypothetical protein